ncbi:MAG: HTH-type transcriptional regulator BhcR [Pseudomonadota bacterium]
MAKDGAPKRSRGRPRTTSADAPAAAAQALDRGLHLLRILSRERRSNLTEIALRAGMPASTAHRLLTTMQRHGVTEFDEDTQEWLVGIEAFRIGSTFLHRTNLVEAGREVMRRLTEDTGETSNLAIPDAGDVVFISQVETHNPIRAFFRSGTRGNMHASGIGKALLAELPRDEVETILQKKGLPEFTPKTLTSSDALFSDLDNIRQRGWALDDEERYVGMRCVAAPIFNPFGEAIAGISVSGPTVRFSDRAIPELGASVRRAAEAVTGRIGGRSEVEMTL